MLELKLRAAAFAAFLGAAICVYALTFAVIPLAWRVGAVDIPEERKIHNAAVPNWGGLGIFIGLFAAVLLLVRPLDARLQAILVGALVVLLIGLADGVRRLPAWMKLIVHVAAATIAVSAGVRIRTLGIPFAEDYLILEQITGFALSVFWIALLTNSINLIDGLDGLASGVCAISAATLCLVSFVSPQEPHYMPILWGAISGSCVGFLFHNFSPARVFMGDGGAYVLGYLLASLSILGAQKTAAAVSLLGPLLAFGFPILETTYTVARRLKSKAKAFSPDKKHIHHRLLETGLTHRETVLVLYGATMLLCATGMFYTLSGSPAFLFAAFAVVGAYAAAFRWYIRRIGI
jgi:UDP-GlcNAc:undecaprenyl-phosphate GlcNAc-1-phosphate transferase